MDRQKRDIAHAASEVKKKKVEAPEKNLVIAQSAIVEEIDLKPRTVSFQGGEDDTNMGDASDVGKLIRRHTYAPSYCQLSKDNGVDKVLVSICTQEAACMFDQGVQEFGYFFWLSRTKHGPAIDAQEIFFIETNQRILTCYYFSQSRPPEQQEYVNRFKWWQLLSLRDIGWGPPNKLCFVILGIYFVMITC